MFKEKTTWLLIIIILGVAFVGGLDHKKNATDEQSQYTLQNGLTK